MNGTTSTSAIEIRMNGSINGLQEHSAGESSPNTVSESALDRESPLWVDPSSIQRESKSDESFAEWKRNHPSNFRPNLLSRPNGGTSRKILLSQIKRLEEDKVLLQSRLQTMMDPTHSTLSRLETDQESRRRSATQSSLPQTVASSSSDDNTAADFPSTFAGASTEFDDGGGQEYMEQVVGLAGRLRKALEPNHKEDSSNGMNGLAHTILDRPELTKLLLQSKPHPEREDQYAQVFAKRNLELYKTPKHRSPMLQAGPLQQIVKHPRYVDILTKCLREPFIAHMGKFDEMEFCLWLVITADFHSADGEDVVDENGELNDSCYEFPEVFLKRFPFAGTEQLIYNTNVWRKQRGEEAIVQTKEMKQAELFTISMQKEAAGHQSSQQESHNNSIISSPALERSKDLYSEDKNMQVSVV